MNEKYKLEKKILVFFLKLVIYSVIFIVLIQITLPFWEEKNQGDIQAEKIRKAQIDFFNTNQRFAKNFEELSEFDPMVQADPEVSLMYFVSKDNEFKARVKFGHSSPGVFIKVPKNWYEKLWSPLKIKRK